MPLRLVGPHAGSFLIKCGEEVLADLVGWDRSELMDLQSYFNPREKAIEVSLATTRAREIIEVLRFLNSPATYERLHRRSGASAYLCVTRNPTIINQSLRQTPTLLLPGGKVFVRFSAFKQAFGESVLDPRYRNEPSVILYTPFSILRQKRVVGEEIWRRILHSNRISELHALAQMKKGGRFLHANDMVPQFARLREAIEWARAHPERMEELYPRVFTREFVARRQAYFAKLKKGNATPRFSSSRKDPTASSSILRRKPRK
jgi:hypothetical protein